MKNILIISLLFGLHAGISLAIFASEELINKEENPHIYSGEYINYIHLVFDDFVKTEVIPKGRNLKIHSKIMFYKFMVEEATDTLTIRIGYNHALVREIFEIQIKDGGAVYQVSKGDMAIKRLYPLKKIK